jgi:hypothetical protein
LSAALTSWSGEAFGYAILPHYSFFVLVLVLVIEKGKFRRVDQGAQRHVIPAKAGIHYRKTGEIATLVPLRD